LVYGFFGLFLICWKNKYLKFFAKIKAN
jgi:hypothetical protein